MRQAAGFYLPQARRQARAGLRNMLRQQRRMDVFRLSNIAITYPQRGQSVATFRERWQSAGNPKLAGEQQVRLVLKRNGERWQIASEDAQPIGCRGRNNPRLHAAGATSSAGSRTPASGLSG